MSTDDAVRLDATVTGRVQGVSFRYYTVQAAQRLGLAGWVANQSDGSVRVVAEGTEQALRGLVDFLHTGSPSAVVTDVVVDWQPATGEYSGFRIRSLW